MEQSMNSDVSFWENVFNRPEVAQEEFRDVRTLEDMSWSQKYLSMIFMHPSRTIPKKFSMWYS